MCGCLQRKNGMARQSSVCSVCCKWTTWEFISLNKSKKDALHRALCASCVCMCVRVSTLPMCRDKEANLLPTQFFLEAKREQKMLTFWQWRGAAVPSASERSLRWVLEQDLCVDACTCVCAPVCLPKAMCLMCVSFSSILCERAEESYKQRCWKCWA